MAVALSGSLEETGGVWLGWSGRAVEAPDPQPEFQRKANYTLATLDLSPAEVRGYYTDFANRALWPLFHGRLDLAQFDHDSHAIYRAVNRKFAAALRGIVKQDDVIWVHDYHLIPLGAELRRLGVANPIGFFLHIPFPPSQALAALPWPGELAKDLCAYDLVGFQTGKCLQNFLDIVTRDLGGSVAENGAFTIEGRNARAGAFPISIDTNAFRSLARSPEVQRRAEFFRRRAEGQTWILGVDRLDYTKGLVERIHAFESLLREKTELQGRISLLQIAAPSRKMIDEYRAMRAELDSLVGKINGELGTVVWTPIRYINRYYDHAQLAALYQVCRIGLITPLCDGMNLVAKEYVAAQVPADPGVLVLSRFAGAAEELTDAVLVNPHDVSATAKAIGTALDMPLAERRRRWERMMAVLEANDVHCWRRRFLSALQSACDKSLRADGLPNQAA